MLNVSLLPADAIKIEKADLSSFGVDPITVAFGEDKKHAINSTLLAVSRHIDATGFMKAASEYEWYGAAWFRDSSMTVISLVQFASMLGNKGLNNSREALIAKEHAKRIIHFLFSTVAGFKQNMERALILDTKNEKFGSLSNHLPARIGPGGKYFRINSYKFRHTDELEPQNCWLRQYDSIPLLLIATEHFIRAFGVKEFGAQDVAKRLLPEMIAYMCKVYPTPCSNAWELENQRFHSYSLASVFMGLGSAAALLKRFEIKENCAFYIKRCSEERNNIEKILNEVFVRDGILFRSAETLSSPEPIREVDGSEIFIFTLFDTPLKEEIKKNTIKKMEYELFGSDILPIRFKGDTYFDGGRWLLLGLEFAYYYLHNGDGLKAEKILDYIDKKYLKDGHELPEQELVNPASPNGDPDKMLERNGGDVIKDLAWSEAEYLRALSQKLQC